MNKLTDQQILDLPMGRNDIGAETVRGYLKSLLLKLWHEGEGFNGKRPFGNSGWEYELYVPLLKAKVVAGKFDEDGYVEDVDEVKARKLIVSAIKSLA